MKTKITLLCAAAALVLAGCEKHDDDGDIAAGFWARSNVVWVPDAASPDGGRLTFATSAGGNTKIPANAGGVYFKWGSLVALSPVGAEYTPAKILYSSTGSKKYAWEEIPMAPADNRFADADPAADDFAAYNGGKGFDATAGKGDICRYITSRGWASGRWRLPTAGEIADLVAPQQVAWWGSEWENIGATAPKENPNGMYLPPSGIFLGKNVNARDDKKSPPAGIVVFPSSGYRGDHGVGNDTGSVGCWWGASSNTSAWVWCGYADLEGARLNHSERPFALPVRCVRD